MGLSATQLARIQSRQNEQRVFARRRLAQPIPVELQPGKTVWLEDLSEGGLSVSGSSEVETGTVAYICFQFPETHSVIDAAGVIAWTDASGRAGVRFTQVKPESSAVLREWLQAEENSAEMNAPAVSNQDAELTGNIASLQEVSELQAQIAAQQLDREAALEMIVQRMMELTRASGAAIVLREDGEAICKASVGNAPEVGVKVSSSSFSGQCFRTGAMVVLNDSETDGRVNAEVCRQLNFRSMAVMPIVAGEQTVGIAEVFSPNASNFESGDVLVLSVIAELIAGIAAETSPESQGAGESIGFPSTIDESALRLAAEELSAAELPSELEAVLPSSQSSAAEPAPYTPVLSARAERPNIPLATPSSVASTRPFLTSPAQFKARVTEDGEQRMSLVMIAAGAAAVALIVFLIWYFGFHSRPAAPAGVSSPPRAAAEAQAIAANPPTLTPQPAAEVPVSSVIRASAQSIHQGAAPAKSREAAIEKADEIQIKLGGSTRQEPLAADNPAPAAPAIAQLDPRVAVLPADIVTSSAPMPIQSKGVVVGKLLRKIAPKYPEMARRAGVSGDVVLTGIIGADGLLHNLKVVSGSPLLQSEAISAARQWRYSPYLLDGKPIDTDTKITISFHR